MSQRRDDALVEKLLPDFFGTQNPGAAWMHAVSVHLALPVLRALWTMAEVDYQRPECRDIAGGGYHLQSANALGDVTFSYDLEYPLVPISVYGGGANQYLMRADGGVANWADIFGTEAQVRAAQRGLTLGGWFHWAALPGATQFLIAKNNGGAQQQYHLNVRPANTIRFAVFPGPVTVDSAATVRVGWNHIVGTYDQPSQTLVIMLNGVPTIGVVGAAPAALPDSTAAFVIGADSAGANRFTGKSSLCFLQACSMYRGGTMDITQALFRFVGSMLGRQE